jgi:hypothetical protein
MWLKLGLVRGGGAPARDPGASSGSGSGAHGTGAAGLGDPVESFTIGELQRYLQQYPPGHYSHGGKEPLLYVVVLLLSLQFRWAGWVGRWAGVEGEGDDGWAGAGLNG